MFHHANTKDDMPSIGGASHLTCCEIQQWANHLNAMSRGRGRCDWNDSRQHFGRPEDGLLAGGPVRVMSESRYPTSS